MVHHCQVLNTKCKMKSSIFSLHNAGKCTTSLHITFVYCWLEIDKRCYINLRVVQALQSSMIDKWEAHPKSGTCCSAQVPGWQGSTGNSLCWHQTRPCHWESQSEGGWVHSVAPHKSPLWTRCSHPHSHPQIHLERKESQQHPTPPAGTGPCCSLLLCTCYWCTILPAIP